MVPHLCRVETMNNVWYHSYVYFIHGFNTTEHRGSHGETPREMICYPVSVVFFRGYPLVI
jgi:hypothetical protein